MRFVLLILFAATLAFTGPNTINFQMVLKDETGKLRGLNAPFTFQLLGNSDTVAWEEVHTIVDDSGTVSVLLGDSISISPSVFGDNDTLKLRIFTGAETLLTKAFDAVPFAIEAAAADSAALATFSQTTGNSQALGGKGRGEKLTQDDSTTLAALLGKSLDSILENGKTLASDSLALTINRDVAKEISDSFQIAATEADVWLAGSLSTVQPLAFHPDSIAAFYLQFRAALGDSIRNYPALDRRLMLAASADSVRKDLRPEISDSLRGAYPAGRAGLPDSFSTLQSTLQSEISVAVAASAPANPAVQISDSLNSVLVLSRAGASDSLSAAQQDLIGNISDSISANDPTTLILDSANSNRSNIRGIITDTLNVAFSRSVTFSDSIIIPQGGGPIFVKDTAVPAAPFHFLVYDTLGNWTRGPTPTKVANLPFGYFHSDIVSVSGIGHYGPSRIQVLNHFDNYDDGGTTFYPEITLLASSPSEIHVRNMDTNYNLNRVKLFVLVRAK